MRSLNAQPTGNVSPTTAHCGSPNRHSTLPKIVDQPGEHEPIGVAGGADRFGRLQQMLQLRELDVRIGIIDQRVEIIERFEDAHLPAVELQELALLRLHEVVRLMAVILAIELADGLAGRIIVVAIILAGLGLRLGIDGIGDEFFPGLASRSMSFG